MHRPLALTLAAVAVILASCAAAAVPAEEPGDGAPIEFDAYPGPTWRDAKGRAVDADTMNLILGHEHCGWQSVGLLHTSWPLGAEGGADAEHRMYVRDPDQVLPPHLVPATLDLAAALPDGARPSGFTAEGLELWLAADVDEFVYLVAGDRTERWPRARELFSCA